MECCGRPNRSDNHVSKEEEAKIEGETREYFDGLAPQRHSKPQRSDYSSTYVDGVPSSKDVIPEQLVFQQLEHGDSQKLVYNGSEARDEFVETEYYKDLNCIDKQHHTTGTGFIAVDNAKGMSFNLAPDNTTDCHASSHGNPATNDWIPAANDMKMTTNENTMVGGPVIPPQTTPPTPPTGGVAPLTVPNVVSSMGILPLTIPTVGHIQQPEKFVGMDFKRWQLKMIFYLTTLNLARYLTEDKPVVAELEHNQQTLAAVDVWMRSDFLCKNYILNGLQDNIYNVYVVKNTAKELWLSLEKRFKTEDADTKKFIIGRFLSFSMVDTRSVVTQALEFQEILQQIQNEQMTMSWSLQSGCLIEKLPDTIVWNSFKGYLKHKKKEMTVDDVILKLRIEEDNMKADKKLKSPYEAKAYVVEQDQTSGNKKKGGQTGKLSGKWNKLGPKGGVSKKLAGAKFQGKCFNCNKVGHRSADCRKPKRQNFHQSQANVIKVEVLSKDVSDINLSAVISKVNMIGSNPREWWVDTGATHHICSEQAMFTSFEPVTNGEKLYMGNTATSMVAGQGKVILKMISGKELTLNNVLYAPDIRKNLVSGSLLSKHGFKMVFEANKVVLTKAGEYVGKGYMSNGLFKLNVTTVYPKINKNVPVAYVIESSSLWHVD